MLRSNFEVLRALKGQRENRKITLRVISAETGLSKDTVSRFSHGDLSKIQLSTILKICEYFELESIDQLIEYSREKAAQ